MRKFFVIILLSIILLAFLQLFWELPLVIILISHIAIFSIPGILTSFIYTKTLNRGIAELLLVLFFQYLGIGIASLVISFLVKNPSISFLLANSTFIAIQFLLSELYINTTQKRKNQVTHKNILSIFILMFCIAIGLFIHYKDIPHYTTTNVDGLSHIVIAKEFFVKNNFSLNLTRVNNSFTVFSYFPTFHLIFGPLLASVPLGTEVVMYNLLDAFFTIITALLLYFLTRRHSETGALLLAISHIFIFERIAAYSSFFLLPQTLTSFLGAILLLSLILKEYVSRWMVLIFPVILISTHFLIGSLWTIIFFMYWFFSRKYIPLHLIKILLFASIYLLVMTFLMNTSYLPYFETIIPDYQARVNELVILSHDMVISTLFQMFGLGLFVIGAILVAALFSKNKFYILLATAISVILITIVTNIPYSGKLLLLLHYLSIMLLFYIGKDVINKAAIFTKTLLTLLATILLVPLFYISSTQYKQTLLQQENVGVSTNAEKEMIMQLNNLPVGVVLSDPLSMTIYESATLHTTLGGVYTSVDNRLYLWTLLRNTNNTTLLPEETGAKNQYVVITQRTVAWEKSEETFINKFANEIWRIPTNALTFDCSNYKHIGELLYNSDSGCILEKR